MSDREALLAAIRANPDDDLPRLVYADWLDENADSLPPMERHSAGDRAAFIRLQVEAARAEPYGPAFRAAHDAANRLRALLALTPTDGGLWALLADVEARRIGFSPRIVNYLDMSRTTGRLEFQAMARRISLGFRVWLALDAPARSALTGEAIRLLQPTTNHRLIAFLASVGAQTRGESAMALRGLVQERAPEWLEKYDAWLRSPPIF